MIRANELKVNIFKLIRESEPFMIILGGSDGLRLIWIMHFSITVGQKPRVYSVS